MEEGSRERFDHYVAQHFIKRFANDNDVVFIGNMHRHVVEETTDTTRIMGDINWSMIQELEDVFTEVEGQVANAFTRLQADPTAIRGLSESTRNGIRAFIGIHYLRSTGIHNNMNDSMQQMGGVLSSIAPNQTEFTRLRDRTITRAESLAMGADVARYLEPMFMTKGCVALIAPPDNEFILGDNPLVVLTSQEEWQGRGAFFMDETYLWFPLNPKVGLFFAVDLGNKISEGIIRHATISPTIVRTLNKAEAYLAVDKIAGSRRGLIRNFSRQPNIGEHRSEVHDMGWAPFIITQNNEHYTISQTVVDDIRSRF